MSRQRMRDDAPLGDVIGQLAQGLLRCCAGQDELGQRQMGEPSAGTAQGWEKRAAFHTVGNNIAQAEPLHPTAGSYQLCHILVV